MTKIVRAIALVTMTTLASNAGAESPRPGMTLAFSDEFDGEALSDKWATHFANGRNHLDGDLQTYLGRDDAEAVISVSGGTLKLTAKRPLEAGKARSEKAAFVSGMASSHPTFSFRYGYAEVRAKVPAGRGLWPAFWLFRTDGYDAGVPYGEIDVMEMLGHEPGKTYSTIHSGPEWKGRSIEQVEADAPSGSFADAMHVYAVDWTDKEISFFVDGRKLGTFPTTDPVKAPMHLLLNLAVGGEWAGAPDDGTRLPATLEIDYVRVWRDAGTE